MTQPQPTSWPPTQGPVREQEPFTFARSIPPAANPSDARQRLDFIIRALRRAKWLGISFLAGSLGVAIYAVLAPISSRTFSISLPWKIEGPLIGVIFLAGALLMYSAQTKESHT